MLQFSIILNIILIVAIIAMIIKWPKTITIKDNLPNTWSAKDAWLKLQDEGKYFVKRDDNKIYLKIVK